MIICQKLLFSHLYRPWACQVLLHVIGWHMTPASTLPTTPLKFVILSCRWQNPVILIPFRNTLSHTGASLERCPGQWGNVVYVPAQTITNKTIPRPLNIIDGPFYPTRKLFWDVWSLFDYGGLPSSGHSDPSRRNSASAALLSWNQSLYGEEKSKLTRATRNPQWLANYA